MAAEATWFRGPTYLDTWMARHGRGLGIVTPAAADVLEIRLRTRRRARSALLVSWVLIIGLFVGSAFAEGNEPDAVGPGLLATLGLIPVALAGGTATYLHLVARSERSVRAGLSWRATESRHTGLPTLLGPARAINLALTVVLALAGGIVIAAGPSLAASSVYFGTLAVVLLCTAGSLRSVTRRPRLAVDASSLGIDDRLRAVDSSEIVRPMALLLATFGFVLGIMPAYQSLFPIALLYVVPLLVESRATSRDRRRHADGPPWLVQPVQT